MNIAAMSAMVKQDSRVDLPLEGESRPVDGVRAPIEVAADGAPLTSPMASGPPDAETAVARPPRKPRTRKPRPTYEDGALTRLFKFPSKAYPRSTYYVTGDEIIIRIKKARKKWKLVIPKKRVVSYKTNRWFAKPRWVELELTVTQATRLGLVEARAPKLPTDDAAAQMPSTAVQVVDDGDAAGDETDPGLDATDGAAGDAGPEVSLIDESDMSAEAEATDAEAIDENDGDFSDEQDEAAWADNALYNASEDEAAVLDQTDVAREADSAGDGGAELPSKADDGPAELAAVEDRAPEATDTFSAVESATSPAAIVAAVVLETSSSPHPPPGSTPVPAPLVVHLVDLVDTAAMSEARGPTHTFGQAAEPEVTIAGSGSASPLAVDRPLTLPPADPLCDPMDQVGSHKATSRSRVFALLVTVLLMVGSAVTLLLRDVEAIDPFAETAVAVEQASAPAILIETGSIIRNEPRVIAPVAELSADPIVSTRQDAGGLELTETSVEPMERKLEWPTQERWPTLERRATASLAEPVVERGLAAPPVEAPRAVTLPAAQPASTAREPLQPSSAQVAACRELKAAASAIKVQFDYASASPDEAAVTALNVVANRLGNCGTGRVIIEGHADADGDADRNQALSVRRAQAVWDYLVEAGASPDKLSLIGFGHSRPEVPNVTPENKHKNRRAILVVETGR